MEIIFITNFLNHHQVFLWDEIHRIKGNAFKFIETRPIPHEFIENGYPVYDRPYLIKSYQSPTAHDYAMKASYEANIVIIGSAPEYFVTKRIKENRVTFRYSERWFKEKPWYFTSLIGWINYYRYHIRHRKKNLFMLAASAYTALDANTIGAYRDKVYKWGYFTKVDMDFKLEAPEPGASSSEITPLMWCARFLSLKHPELPIQLARRLKDKGYKFVLDMYGSGVELERMQKLTRELDVCDVVNFCGVLPNDQILEQMKKHEIFLFTSDFNEGWGAVLNESMSCGCAVVASHAIGSVPFLIKDGINGYIYENENLYSLEQKVRLLLDNPKERYNLRIAALQTMKQLWNPKVAAIQLLSLIDSILLNDKSLIPVEGPASKATIIKC